MQRGFMELVPSIIKEFPGETAEFYAREALDSGIVSSDAKDPVLSLANTLAKQVREGREPGIRREQIGGKYRYFLVSEPDEGHLENIAVQIFLSTQEIEVLDNLVAVGKCKNRSDAIMWLAREGIKARGGYLDKVADTRKQIERIKAAVL